MKQVAAAKIRRAEIVQKQARPYAEALGEMLRDLIDAVGSVDHPFMKPGKEGAPKGVLLMTADKGLAGAFNSNVIARARSTRARAARLRGMRLGTRRAMRSGG
jgi:F-type H+-transporting ATPase subunit gamma